VPEYWWAFHESSCARHFARWALPDSPTCTALGQGRSTVRSDLPLFAEANKRLVASGGHAAVWWPAVHPVSRIAVTRPQLPCLKAGRRRSVAYVRGDLSYDRPRPGAHGRRGDAQASEAARGSTGRR
jgi:hypothetical protein